MKFRNGLWRCALAVLACALLAGCLPSNQSQFEEEKEPHFIAGKTALNSMDYKGAIQEFEKALEVNPHSAAAHFQLGWLYEEKEPDPAAAIYHYEQYLKLRPDAENAEIIRQHILNCKQDLAKAVLPLPITPEMQRQIDQLVEENRTLRDELEKWRAYYRSQQKPRSTGQGPEVPTPTPTPLAASSGVAASPVNTPLPGAAKPQPAPARNASRRYTVQRGETCASIARKYGISLETLLAANPSVQPRRLRVGQTLNIP